MLKNIIFDMGNVIFTFDFDHLLGSFYKGEHFDFLKERIFSKWVLMDDDTMTHTEYKKMVLTGLPDNLKKPAEGVLDRWEEFMEPMPGVDEFIKELKAEGYKLFLLSNIPMHFIERQYMFPVLELFDGKIFSGEVKLLKPDAKIFEYLLKKYSLNADESLFIDDTKENIVSATKLGFNTFLFDKKGKNLDELKNLINDL